MQRVVNNIVTAMATRDGDGVNIARSVGSPFLAELDPFLLLDELRGDDASDYIGGFPSHPHRGFETVTYMLEGKMRHKDSEGNEGIIASGDLQWMTAGSGIVHSEMPEQNEGRLWGFQCWINLPSQEKMCRPRYQEIPSKDIPEWQGANGKVRVLAGTIDSPQSGVLTGAIKDIVTQPLLLDVQLDHGSWQTRLPKTHATLVYMYRGAAHVGNAVIKEQQLAILSEGDLLTLQAQSGSFGALVLSASPLNEPIVRSGPFVMNTPQELQQAFNDYRSGQFIQ